MAMMHLMWPSSHVFQHLQAGPFHQCDMHATQKKKEKKKKGKEDIPSEPIYGLHAAASPEPVVSLWVEEGGQLHADHRLRAETMGNACDVGTGCYHHCHCCQDLAIVWQLQLLARQGWGCVRMV